MEKKESHPRSSSTSLSPQSPEQSPRSPENQQGFLSRPLPRYIPLEELPEIATPIQPLHQQTRRTLNALAAAHIGLQTPTMPIPNCSALFRFKNETNTALFINGQLVKPKEKIKMELTFLKLTHQLATLAISIHHAKHLQLRAGIPLAKYEQDSQLALITGMITQLIPELPEHSFYTYAELTNGQTTQSKFIDGADNYYVSVILKGQNRSHFQLLMELENTKQTATESLPVLERPRQAPAFPTPKKQPSESLDEKKEKKGGSLISATVRALKRTGSLINLKEEKKQSEETP